MKFTQSAELKIFIIDHNLFADFTDMSEIYSGGSSYNFCIRTADKKIILKLINDEKRYVHLKNILQNLGISYNLSQQRFNDFFLLALPYFEGRKVKSKDFNVPTVEHFYSRYEMLQKALQNSDEVIAAYNLADLVAEVDNIFAADTDFIKRLICKIFWQPFKTKLVVTPQEKVVLHGDLTVNNILQKNQDIFLLDYETVRYGAETEDIAGLLLQLSGFRSLYGNLTEFSRLYNLFNAYKFYSVDDWLYGVQMFYINTLLRRLRNTDKKRRSYRKSFCLLIILLGYWRIHNFFAK